MVVIPRSCQGIREGGGPCRAAPLRDSDYCLMHSPEHAEEMAEARRLGGQRRRREVTLAGVYDLEELDSVRSMRRLLTIAATDVLSLENSIARARVLVSIALAASRLVEVGELDERMRAIEAMLNPRAERNRVTQYRRDHQK